MGYPKSFFEFAGADIRISEIMMINYEEGHLVVRMKDGCRVKHRDHNGSASKLRSSLLTAITEFERCPAP